MGFFRYAEPDQVQALVDPAAGLIHAPCLVDPHATTFPHRPEHQPFACGVETVAERLRHVVRERTALAVLVAGHALVVEGR